MKGRTISENKKNTTIIQTVGIEENKIAAASDTTFFF